MLKEIKDLYLEESNLYIRIKNILENIDVENIDQDNYHVELENVEYLVNKIGTINVKIEQLKTLYVTKHNLKDFIGEEIKKVEKIEDYDNFKDNVMNVSKLILTTKKLNDEINLNLQRRMKKLSTLRYGVDKSTLSKSFLFPQKDNSGLKLDKKK